MISIILPVYNVEPYLRQCLDSVVNQTMQEIQIICVNDGSTDGSPAILEEYAAGDSRIEIIHQENQGGGSARNAAYPFIRGKYVYFVDPDDWLELDLCQQCYDKAEETEADCVFFRAIVYSLDLHPVYELPLHAFDSALSEIRQSPEEKRDLIQWLAPWMKFWRSDFLLSNKIRYSEGKRPCNDILQSWNGMVLANRIAVLDRLLYHHRMRQGSYQETRDETLFVMVETMDEVEKMLHETGFYASFKDCLVEQRLNMYCAHYGRFSPSLRQKFVKHIHRYWTESDSEFCFAGIHRLHSVEIPALHAEIQRYQEESNTANAEVQRSHSNLTLLLQRHSIYWHYYRCKVLATITFGYKRRHYREKCKVLHEKVRQIRKLGKLKFKFQGVTNR